MGVITWYGGLAQPEFQNQPLYCSTITKPLYYNHETAPWIAMPVSWFEEKKISCGDLVNIHFPNGAHLHARAWDAGPLEKYYVQDHPLLPIVADVPWEHWPLETRSSTAYVINTTAWKKMLGKRTLSK